MFPFVWVFFIFHKSQKTVLIASCGLNIEKLGWKRGKNWGRDGGGGHSRSSRFGSGSKQTELPTAESPSKSFIFTVASASVLQERDKWGWRWRRRRRRRRKRWACGRWEMEEKEEEDWEEKREEIRSRCGVRGGEEKRRCDGRAPPRGWEEPLRGLRHRNFNSPKLFFEEKD